MMLNRRLFMRISKHTGIWSLCIFILFAIVQPGSTQSDNDVDIECPLCHTEFKANLDVSSSRGGMRLDLKPVGSIEAPWKLPQCPVCHFIVYKHDLSDQEIEQLRNIVNSDAYKKLLADNSTYYLLAKIYEQVGMPDLEIAHTYLKASWQVEKDKSKCAGYLEASLKKFYSFLSGNKEKNTPWMMSELVAGEIERRLGKFDLAEVRFNRLKKLPEFRDARNVADIISYQLALIAAKDTGPHEIDR
jgi:uncharacterized protein (DUF2225 family)